MTNRSSLFRIIVASLMLVPAIMFGGLQLIARPDLETWLAAQAQGFARPDAFDGVTATSYPSSFFSALLHCLRRIWLSRASHNSCCRWLQARC